jgi:NAD(P)-dependent dehydrogenase (short-subunit alcohol dehydrogenase family)
MSTKNILIFGASGAIGGAIVNRFINAGDKVIAVGRKGKPDGYTSSFLINWITWDVAMNGVAIPLPEFSNKIDAVVWAQGANCTDDIRSFDLQKHEDLYKANVTYILITLKTLLDRELLAPAARLCVISSIWQNIARQTKLSYCITKSALQGLVNSLAIDLGKEGYLINAVLPGALDTPMTRANLNVAQIERLEELTPLGSLPTLDDVSGLVQYLCSKENRGVTGQFINADKGFSHARIL